MAIVPFHAFVGALDAALRAASERPKTIIFEEQPLMAAWVRPPFRAGVERHDLSVRAWIEIGGVTAREFHEPLTVPSAERLGREFAALLSAGNE